MIAPGNVNPLQGRRRAAVAALLLLPALASCGVSFDAQTDEVYNPAQGVNNRKGTVDVLNALIVSGTDGTGRLIAGLANEVDADDKLTGVTGGDSSQGLQITVGQGETTIPGQGFLQLADDEAPMIEVIGDPAVVKPGQFLRVVLSFENGEAAELNVPVVAPGEDFAYVELPTGGASTSESPVPTDEPTEEQPTSGPNAPQGVDEGSGDKTTPKKSN